MLNTGFGYQAWNAKRGPSPSPQQMGAALQQQQQQAGGMPTLGMGSVMPMGAMPDEDSDPNDADDLPTLAVDGQSAYDPAAEHSASNTRAALEDAIRRSKDIAGRSALQRPPAPGQAWQLATLGLDPLTIKLFESTGDAAGGPE